MVVPTILVISWGLDQLLNTTPLKITAALVLCLLSTTAAYTLFYDEYFTPDCYKHKVFVSKYKLLAKALPGLLKPGDIVASTDPATSNAVNWYLNRYVADNFFLNQKLGPEPEKITLNLFSPYRSYAHLGKNKDEFLNAIGRPETVVPVRNASLYRIPLQRTPVTRIPKIPFSSVKSMGLMDFYKEVHALNNVTVLPYWGGEIEPTRNLAPGTFEYVFDNDSEVFPQLLSLGFEYKNLGEDNTITVSTRFDDQPAVVLFTSRGVDPKRGRRFLITRRTPYKRLAILVRLVCAEKTPLYPGGNLETIAFRKILLDIVPSGVFDSKTIEHVEESGLARVEYNDVNLWRWGLGPKTVLSFDLDKAGPVILDYALESSIPKQGLVVTANGETLEKEADLPPNARLAKSLRIRGLKGRNTIEFAYTRWNNNSADPDATFAKTDIRPMAVFFKKLLLERPE